MKVSIVGSGFGERVMALVYRHVGFEVVAVASPRDTEAVARALAADVDLVSIHSPPFLHHEHVMRAFDQGRRAVLCDKPFGRDAAEARAMRDRARELGALNFLNFEFRQHPSRAKLTELVRDGRIGALQHVSWTFIGNGLRQQKHRWLFDKDLAGGWIGAWGSHAIDGLRCLFESEVADCGGVSRIETTSRPDREGVVRPSTAEDAFSAWFVMGNGRTATIDTAFSTPVAMPTRIVAMGSEGSLELLDDLTLTLRRPGGKEEVFTFPAPSADPHEPGLVPWLSAVKAAVASRTQITPSFDDGLAVAEAMDRLRATLVRAG